MNKFISLTKVLLKAGGSPFQLKAKNKAKSIALIIFIVLCFIPMMVLTTYAFMSSYDALYAKNLQGTILSSMMAVSCLAMILFGILYVVSIYYYAEDTENLISLPIKPSQILASKFVLVVIYEYFIEFFTILPVLIAYGIKMHSVMFWIYSVIVYLFLPVIPVVICSIITMIVMSFTGIIKNKDAFKVISGVIIIAIAMGFSFVSQGIGKGSSKAGDHEIADLFINNKDKINAAGNAFPTARIPSWSLIESNSLKGLLFLIIFIAVSVLFFYIFTIIGQGLYFKGAIGINESSSFSKKISETEFSKITIKRSKLKAYVFKELKLLIRTPAYFLNCILSGVILPPLMVVLILTPEKAELTKHFTFGPVVFVVACGTIGLFCSLNSVTATAVSREGKNLYICRYIPMEVSTQVWAKVLSGIVVNVIGCILTIITGGIILKIPPAGLIMIFIVSIFATTLISFIGIMIDITMPKLSWDNETAAVKNNLNVMLNMIASLVIFGAVTTGAIILALNLKMEVTGIFILMIIIYVILDIIMFCIVQGPGVKAFSKIEQ